MFAITTGYWDNNVQSKNIISTHFEQKLSKCSVCRFVKLLVNANQATLERAFLKTVLTFLLTINILMRNLFSCSLAVFFNSLYWDTKYIL